MVSAYLITYNTRCIVNIHNEVLIKLTYMRKISASFSIFAYMNKKLVILEEKKCLIVKFKLFVETGA